MAEGDATMGEAALGGPGPQPVRRLSSPRWSRLLGIRGGEQSLALWIAVLFAVSQASQGLGVNAADTLFFLRFGVEFLPTMILLAGPVVMVAMLVYAAGLGRLGARRWLPSALFAFAGVLVLERLGIGVDLPGVYPVVWLAGQAIMMLSFTAMWGAAGDACTTRQAKRLYPFFASAGIAGGMVGNASTGPLAAALGTENLLLVQAGLLVVAAAIALVVGRRFFRSEPDADSGPVMAELRAGLAVTLGSRLLRLVAAVGVGLGVLLFLVVFPFSEVVSESFASEAEVAGYLGTFSAVATAATFVVSLVVTNRLFARLGVVATLMVVPVVYVGGFALWLFSFNLAAATLVRGLQFIAVNAVGGTAWSSLFNVLPTRRRGQVMAFMAAGPSQLGTMVSGVLLLVGSALPMQARSALGLAVAAVTVVAVWMMRAAYGEALVDAVRRGLVDVFTSPITGMQKPVLDADTLRAMTVGLHDPRPEARALAASMLGRMPDSRAHRLLVGALRDDDARVRRAALDALALRGEWLEELDVLVGDSDPEIRRRALELAWRAGEAAVPAARPALDDDVPAVRGAAATAIGGEPGRRVVRALLQSEPTQDVVAGLHAVARRPELADGDLTAFVAHPDRRVRAAAAQALAGAPAKIERVRPLLDDSSVLVRRSAAEALVTDDRGVAALLAVLEHGSVRACEAALHALARSRQAGSHLAEWASREIGRAAYLRRHRVALQGLATSSEAAAYLVRLLEARERRLERWAIVALTTPETVAAMPIVVRGMWSGDPETRAQAMEALDSIGDRLVVRDLLALLEDPAPATMADPRSSLRVLSDDMDDWLRALAIRCLREELMRDLGHLVDAAEQDPSDLVTIALARWELPVMRETETLDVMERVLALQRVPMFSEIDPEDLERIALITDERHHEPEEMIFPEGAEGDEMLIIIRGEVSISRTTGEETTHIRSYGPGDHVGELALLRSRPRAADVVAGPEGVHTLALRAEEFGAILEERPEVALAMLGTLAERLATM